MRVSGPVQSFFKNERDYEEASKALARLMEGRDSVTVSHAVACVCGPAPYANRNHVTEIVMRDRRFMFKGEDKLRPRALKAVEPPRRLFFGTTAGMADRFLKNGASSRTKGYVKAHDTMLGAALHAMKFTRDGEAPVVLEVDASSMTDSRFTMYETGEYCVREIPARCLRKGTNGDA